MIFVIFSLFDLLSKIRRFFLLFIFVISNFILSLYQTKQTNIMETNYFIFRSQFTEKITGFACCNEDVQIVCHQDDMEVRTDGVLNKEYFEKNDYYEECTRQEFMNEFTKLQKKLNGLIKEI